MLYKILLNGFQSENAKSLAAAYHLLLDFQGNLTWEVVKEGKSHPDLTFITNISRGHYYGDEAISNFQNVSICKTKKVWILSPAC